MRSCPFLCVCCTYYRINATVKEKKYLKRRLTNEPRICSTNGRYRQDTKYSTEAIRLNDQNRKKIEVQIGMQYWKVLFRKIIYLVLALSVTYSLLYITGNTSAEFSLREIGRTILYALIPYALAVSLRFLWDRYKERQNSR